jgi:hypothetical protein
MKMREDAAAASGNAYLFADCGVSLQHDVGPPAPAGFDSAHQSSGARTNDDHISNHSGMIYGSILEE